MKGPKKEGLEVLRPINDKFRQLLSYRYYRLRHTEVPDMRDKLSLVRKNTGYIAYYLRYKFGAEDPIRVLEFLSHLVRECDGLYLSEREAYAMLPNFLEGAASLHLDSCQRLGDSSDAGVTDWSSAINCLLEAFATDQAIQEAVTELNNTRQKGNETEAQYHTRFIKAHTRAGSYLRENELVTLFIESLDERIRPRMRSYHYDKPRMNMMQVLRLAKTEGETARAVQVRPSRDRGILRPTKGERGTGRQVNVLRTAGVHPWSEPDTESDSETMDASEGLPPEGMYHQTMEADMQQLRASSTVMPLYSQKGVPRTGVVPPISPGTYPYRNPGWVNKQPSIGKPSASNQRNKPPGRPFICWRCYVVGQHYANGCGIDLRKEARVVIANFETLTAGQKAQVPWEVYLTLKGYLTDSVKDTPGDIDNPFASTVPDLPSTPSGTERSVTFEGKD